MASDEGSKKFDSKGVDGEAAWDKERAVDLSQFAHLKGYESPIKEQSALAEAVRIAKEQDAWRSQVENLGAAARFAAEVSPIAGEYAQQRAAIDRIFELQSEAASGIDNLESIRELTRKRRDTVEFMESPALMNPNAYRDQKQDEFQGELIRVLKTTSEQTEQTSKLQAQLVSKKEGPWTKFTAVMTAIVLLVTLWGQYAPNRSESPIANTTNDAVIDDKVLESPVKPAVLEEPTPPQPEPTPAHAPADNAPSSSDRRGP